MKNWQKVSISAAIILFCAAIIIASLLYNPELPKSDQELRFHLASNRKFLGFENKSTQFSEFFFIHGSDPQFGLFEAFENPNITIAKNWTQDQYLLRKAVQQWNEMKPKFVVITGDLVHDSPEKPNSQRTKQLADLKMELEKLDQTIPLVLLPGNHDIENEPTEKALNNYKSEFGDDYFSFWVNSVMFIVLNSQLYKEHHLLEKEYEMQNKWLTEQLNDALKNKYTHVIVFQHIPWFLQDINESDNGSNNYFTIAMKERKEMVDRLYNAKVRYVFAGHLHRNYIGSFKELNMITTSAIGAQMNNGLANAKSGYRKVTVEKDKVSHEYIEIETNTNR